MEQVRFFGCPVNDQRDFDFAKKYNLEITKVVDDGAIKKMLKPLILIW